MMASDISDTTRFIQSANQETIPPKIIHQARRCLLDTLGVAAGASTLPLASIVKTFCRSQFGGAGGFFFFSQDTLSSVGAAFANGAMIDSLDQHDGHNLTKGHA